MGSGQDGAVRALKRYADALFRLARFRAIQVRRNVARFHRYYVRRRQVLLRVVRGYRGSMSWVAHDARDEQ